jgi:hypothetical protein
MYILGEYYSDLALNSIKEKEIQLEIPGRVEKITTLVTVKFVGK